MFSMFSLFVVFFFMVFLIGEAGVAGDAGVITVAGFFVVVKTSGVFLVAGVDTDDSAVAGALVCF